MKYFRILTLISLTVLTSVSALADENRRDGNWWLNQPETVQAVYAVGFFDGVDLGHHFSIWKYANNKKSRETWIPLANKSFNEYTEKYLNNVTSGQLIDGLNSFYSDYRNRRIRVQVAVWLVASSIAGTPEAELNKMIENWRKNPY